MLFVDAGNNRVGIGESSPATFLDLAFTSIDQTDGIQIHNKQFGGYGGAIEWVSRTAASLGGGSDRLAGQIQVAGANNWATDDNIESVMKFSLVEDNTFRNILELNPTAEAVINQDSIDMDFRVESQSKTHALFVDGGTNAVGINSSAPGASQTFADTSVAPNFHVDSDGFSNGPLFTYNNTGVFLGMANDVGSGTRYYITFGDSSSARYGDITSNGSVMTYGGTSDHRLKTNVQAMSGSIDRVKNLNPVTFDWISSGINAEGFIAHEVQSVVPDAATGTHNEVDSNGKPVYQQIDPRHIVPLLTGALKEAITKIETLEARITALES